MAVRLHGWVWFVAGVVVGVAVGAGVRFALVAFGAFTIGASIGTVLLILERVRRSGRSGPIEPDALRRAGLL